MSILSREQLQRLLIAAASITSDLSRVQGIAKGMKLSVMNAKAIAARAGDSARGFQPITDYIDEMAKDVMRLVALISQQSLKVSRVAVEMNQVFNSAERFTRVLAEERKDRPHHVESVRPLLKRTMDRSQQLRRDFLRNISNLEDVLEGIYQDMRASIVIATNSRVEASQTQQFRDNLEVIADDLEQATDRIRKYLKKSYQQIAIVKDILAEERYA